MPLLLILFLVAACLPLPWPAPPFGLDPSAAAWLTLSTQAVPVLLGWAAAARVVRLARTPAGRPRAVTVYHRTRLALPYLNLLAAIAGIVGWGWAATLTAWATGDHFDTPGPVLFPAAELLVPAPYLTALLLNWVGYFAAERALAGTSPAGRGASWTLPGYLLFQARQLALTAGLPVGLFVAQQSATRLAPAALASATAQIVAGLAGVTLVVLLPVVVRPLLGLRPLPAGPVRDLLHATRRRVGVRVSRLFVWPTRGGMANAVMLGVLPRPRYVAFTDRLLEELTPAELVAVYGHEAGHARHGHPAYYALFLMLSATAGTALLAAFPAEVPADGTEPPAWGPWLVLLPLAGMGVYLFAGFGWLSRRCERQADVFGARVGSCGSHDCRGHDADTRLLGGTDLAGRGVCRTGALALASALDRVADLNGADRPFDRQPLRTRLWAWVRAWQHGPMTHRIAFLHRLADDPTLAVRADRKAFAARVGLVLLLVGVIAAVGMAVGWEALNGAVIAGV